MSQETTERDLAPASLLDETAASEYLGDVPPRTLRQWRYLGRGPAYVKVGDKHVRYRRADLDAFMAGGRVDPQGAA